MTRRFIGVYLNFGRILLCRGLMKNKIHFVRIVNVFKYLYVIMFFPDIIKRVNTVRIENVKT